VILIDKSAAAKQFPIPQVRTSQRIT